MSLSLIIHRNYIKMKLITNGFREIKLSFVIVMIKQCISNPYSDQLHQNKYKTHRK